ncbi:phosphotransferase [Nonomuraea candida]|uniref:phosphotransferase n=1 Tax=Nonomuraea candida TaxID=359159 RepID=UPI0005BA1908|nr:phosphotransferase [Nonomuraea candida]
MNKDQLRGGNDAGAVRVDDTVRRPVRAWTASVHELLRHLERKGFQGAPRVLGIDAEGREILTYIEGETMGEAPVWPWWTRTEETLVQVAEWTRAYHEAVADFVPSAAARWRTGGRWAPGMIIAHNDASPFNAAWQAGRLTGFFDWDFAGPVTPESDVAWMAHAWVPLYARHVAALEGLRDFDSRAARLRLFLDVYGYTGDPQAVVREIQARMRVRVAQIRRYGVSGDGLYAKLLRRGVADDVDVAIRELDEFLR